MRRCKKCNQEKRAADFCSAPAGAKSYTCRECANAATRERRALIMARTEIPLPAEKTCSGCGETKAAGEFYRRSDNLDGLQGKCKPCHDTVPSRSTPGRREARRRRAERVGRDFHPSASTSYRSWVRPGMAALARTERRLTRQIQVLGREKNRGRRCRRCRRRKPLESFPQHACARGGRGHTCKRCKVVVSCARARGGGPPIRWGIRRLARVERLLSEKRDGRECRACGERKPLAEFHRGTGNMGGRRYTCKSCNIDKACEWAYQNRERAAAKVARYHARRRDADAGTVSAEYRRQLLAFSRRCYWCKGRLREGDVAIDHVIPLNAGGPNCRSNLCVSCISCNTSKRDRLPGEWSARPQLALPL